VSGSAKFSNAERNRTIARAADEGKSIFDLAAIYRLSITTVEGILHAERHKREVSPDLAYSRPR
jgi:Mor family transcriptional regulator